MSTEAKADATSTTETLGKDPLAGINEDGSISKMVAAPMLVVAAAVVLITFVRAIQKSREKAELERSLNEREAG
jgi:hypothetical protein